MIFRAPQIQAIGVVNGFHSAPAMAETGFLDLVAQIRHIPEMLRLQTRPFRVSAIRARFVPIAFRKLTVRSRVDAK
jgi:hypothetical protein